MAYSNSTSGWRDSHFGNNPSTGERSSIQMAGEVRMPDMLSEHFSRDEFACPCCGKCEVDPDLLAALEQLRTNLGKPITVLSGYRCPLHNAKVRGAHGSEHMQGKAADIIVPGLPLWQLKAAAIKIPRFEQGGIGDYLADGHLHVDVRLKPARW
jgi:zinc D-Ala-D-Ala carboxypeptidase